MHYGSSVSSYFTPFVRFSRSRLLTSRYVSATLTSLFLTASALAQQLTAPDTATKTTARPLTSRAVPPTLLLLA
ncbi:hypothetical protein [Hymenobacter volaticus]|uniref:Uncharacterized protein n=1 Tax=Hymenobacter volaticus TaxID=2932254 RepID=A0ABY4GA84_9BACT|nr:hypothetical protein [Hymenobacter volaticus]UOQ67814.1 hypothetical protein MUN86_08140 [Hymenobacter volaticus]